MTKSKMPEFSTVSEAEEFVETHDLSEYFDELPVVPCEFKMDKPSRLATDANGWAGKASEKTSVEAA